MCVCYSPFYYVLHPVWRRQTYVRQTRCELLPSNIVLHPRPEETGASKSAGVVSQLSYYRLSCCFRILELLMITKYFMQELYASRHRLKSDVSRRAFAVIQIHYLIVAWRMVLDILLIMFLKGNEYPSNHSSIGWFRTIIRCPRIGWTRANFGNHRPKI